MHPQLTMRAWDITIGTRIGRVVVQDGPRLRAFPGGGHIRIWYCHCECGNTKWIAGRDLASGNTRSCGCLHGQGAVTHGATRGRHVERLYTIWQNMLRRCLTPTSTGYRHYGGRGITVCEAWKGYPAFRAWAWAHGYTDTLSIDRIDNDGHYTPDNCQWIPLGAQANNTRRVHRVEAFGERKTIADWARDPRCVVPDKVLRQRIMDHGWDIEAAISHPLNKRRFWKRPA